MNFRTTRRNPPSVSRGSFPQETLSEPAGYYDELRDPLGEDQYEEIPHGPLDVPPLPPSETTDPAPEAPAEREVFAAPYTKLARKLERVSAQKTGELPTAGDNPEREFAVPALPSAHATTAPRAIGGRSELETVPYAADDGQAARRADRQPVISNFQAESGTYGAQPHEAGLADGQQRPQADLLRWERPNLTERSVLRKNAGDGGNPVERERVSRGHVASGESQEMPGAREDRQLPTHENPAAAVPLRVSQTPPAETDPSRVAPAGKWERIADDPRAQLPAPPLASPAEASMPSVRLLSEPRAHSYEPRKRSDGQVRIVQPADVRRLPPVGAAYKLPASSGPQR